MEVETQETVIPRRKYGKGEVLEEVVSVKIDVVTFNRLRDLQKENEHLIGDEVVPKLSDFLRYHINRYIGHLEDSVDKDFRIQEEILKIIDTKTVSNVDIKKQSEYSESSINRNICYLVEENILEEYNSVEGENTKFYRVTQEGNE